MKTRSNSLLRLAMVCTLMPLTTLTISCQTQSVSLEKAKEITADFDSAEFDPPPRSVRDIKKLLEESSEIRSTTYKMDLSIADQPISMGSSALDYALRLRDRARSAKRIGRDMQYVEDIRAAHAAAQKLSIQDSSEFFIDAAMAELLVGDYWKAIGYLEASYAVIEPLDDTSAPMGGKEHHKAAQAGLLAHLYAEIGNLSEAEDYLEKAQEHLDELYVDSHARNNWQWRVLGASVKGVVHYARAGVYLASDRYELAENEARYGLISMGEARSAARIRFYFEPVLAGLTEDLVTALIYQQRLAEAEVEARKAVKQALSRTGSTSLRTNAALIDALIPVLVEQGRFDDADVLARTTLEVYRSLEVSESALKLNKTRFAIAASLAYQGRWDESLDEYEGIRDMLGADSFTFTRYVSRRAIYNLALVRSGRYEDALPHIDSLLDERRSSLGDNHVLTAEARGVYAMAIAGSGDRQRAIENFDLSVPVLIDNLAISSQPTTAQLLRTRLILEANIDVLAEGYSPQHDKQDKRQILEKTFLLATIARSQRVQQALAAGAARAAAGNPELRELSRREQEAKRRIRGLYSLLAANAGNAMDDANPRVAAEVQTKIAALEEARLALLEEIEDRFPSYADLVNPKPMSLTEVRSMLTDNEALIATYSTEKQTYLWAISPSTEATFALADVNRAALAQAVARLRESLDPAVDRLEQIPEFDLIAGYELYELLLSPIEKAWKPAMDLLVVTHGPLGQLPLSVLPTEPVEMEVEANPLFSSYRKVPWLARTHTVTVLPNVGALIALRRARPTKRAPKPFVGFADPLFEDIEADSALPRSGTERYEGNAVVDRRMIQLHRRSAPLTRTVDSADLANLPRLPETVEEVKSMATALGASTTADVYLRERATETAVKTGNFSNRRIIAFATHGLVPGDLDGLTQPALAFTTPEIVGGDDDGVLMMGEILGLDLNAELIVLSACNTAAGDGAGTEAISGLGRAFFYAGARSLLVSNWPVETTSAKALTTRIIERYAKDPSLTRANAVREAMLELIDRGGYRDRNGQMHFSYAHPIFWGPFSLVGDGSGISSAEKNAAQ